MSYTVGGDASIYSATLLPSTVRHDWDGRTEFQEHPIKKKVWWAADSEFSRIRDSLASIAINAGKNRIKGTQECIKRAGMPQYVAPKVLPLSRLQGVNFNIGGDRGAFQRMLDAKQELEGLRGGTQSFKQTADSQKIIDQLYAQRAQELRERESKSKGIAFDEEPEKPAGDGEKIQLNFLITQLEETLYSNIATRYDISDLSKIVLLLFRITPTLPVDEIIAYRARFNEIIQGVGETLVDMTSSDITSSNLKYKRFFDIIYGSSTLILKYLDEMLKVSSLPTRQRLITSKALAKSLGFNKMFKEMSADEKRAMTKGVSEERRVAQELQSDEDEDGEEEEDEDDEISYTSPLDDENITTYEQLVDITPDLASARRFASDTLPKYGYNPYIPRSSNVEFIRRQIWKRMQTEP